MTTPPSTEAPQFRVGPETDPDRYVLGPAVSSGAEGILYRGSITTAAGVRLDVAIKMLQPRFLSHVDEWHVRWTEQVELLRSLQVPGVVPVRDGFLGPLPHPPGQADDGQTLYLVMNWVEGETLDEWIRHRPDRNPIDDLKVLVPVAAALDLMHSGRATGGVPVVHRDIKAANIIVSEHGSVLVDFGLTRGLPDGQRLSNVVGTPGYLAPESIEAGSYSAASDRYAFGGVAYFVLTGAEPPRSHEPEAMRRTLFDVPELAEHSEVSDQVMAMLATNPDERPLGVANWVGQLRRSSLDAGPEILNPAAPRRHPSSPRKQTTGSARRLSVSKVIPLAVGIAIVIAAVSGLLVFGSRVNPVSANEVNYQFTTMNNPWDPNYNEAVSINDSNSIVGYYGTGSAALPSTGYTANAPYHPSSFKPVATRNVFSTTQQTQLTAINKHGYTAGTSVDKNGAKTGFVDWDNSCGPVSNSTSHFLEVLGMNDGGYVVGLYLDAQGKSQAGQANQSGGPIDPIKFDQQGTNTIATGINNQRNIVGYTSSPNGSVGFFLSPNDHVTFVHPYPGSWNVQVLGINNEDWIVGSYQSRTGTHGFVMSDPAGPVTRSKSINYSPNDKWTVVNGINDRGDLVGSYKDQSGIHGFLATANMKPS